VTQPSKPTERRSMTTEIEIAAAVDAVWRALTDAGELVRWFPLDARVTPGPGGTIWLSWGDPVVAVSRIDIWEPGRHLRLVEVSPFGKSLEPANADRSTTAAAAPETGRTIDYVLEPWAGRTVLRLVHSGFDAASDWDDELYHAVRRGWQYELRSLRHYLERHAGTPRSVAQVQQTVPWSSADEAWARITGPGGLLGPAGIVGLAEGEPYTLHPVTGDRLRGIVQVDDPPHQFAGTVADLNDALFRLKLVADASGALDLRVWLATYGVPEPTVRSFEQQWTLHVQDLINHAPPRALIQR
jgi:uncharacterized protein YndB with AHSA1/START domain